MKGTKEFYELMEQFERDIKGDCISVFGHKIERVKRNEKVPSSIFYHDGVINALFQAYMSGYQFAKCKQN